MPAIDAAMGQTVLDAMYDQSGSTVRLATAPIHVRLIVTGTVSTSTVNGSELATGSGYTQGAGAPTVSMTLAATQPAGVPTKTSNGACTVTNMPAVGAPGILGAETWDSSGTPKRIHWGLLTAAKIINLGDTFTIPSGSLTATQT